MMKKIIFIFLLINLVSCGSKNTVKLEHLDGYWEIDHVMFANATKKKYALNLTVDYFHFENDKGYVKKVHPQLDGTYKASRDRQLFQIEQTETGVYLIFENGIREQITLLTSDRFILQTQDSTLFHYKSYEPLKLPINE